jgi:hypothetical protein
VQTLFYPSQGQHLLTAGSLIGAGVAMIVFALSVVSVPLLLDRPIDAVSAMATSLQAVRRNPAVMALWAVLIVALNGGRICNRSSTPTGWLVWPVCWQRRTSARKMMLDTIAALSDETSAY